MTDTGSVATAAKFPGRCRGCGNAYPAGEPIEHVAYSWAHTTCAERMLAQRDEALTQGSTKDQLAAVLRYARVLWPTCSRIETDVRVQKTDADEFAIHTRPVLVLTSGERISSAEFRRRDSYLYYASADILSRLVNDYFDGRYPDFVSYP